MVAVSPCHGRLRRQGQLADTGGTRVPARLAQAARQHRSSPVTLGPATDVTGVSFLSYRRSRLQEARLLLQAQHDLGVPTWQDLDDLGTGQTETQLRSILASPTTANGLLWLTPEVQGSVV